MKRSKKQELLNEKLVKYHQLVQQYPDEAAIRKQFVDMLFEVYTAFDEVNFRFIFSDDQRTKIINQFKKFADTHPEDVSVQLRLMETLREAVTREERYEILSVFLYDAYVVVQRLPNIIRIREGYTNVLSAAFQSPSVKDNRQVYFSVLDELRKFAEKHYIDEFTWNEFANQLANVNIDNRFKDNLIQRDKMLIELRVLSDRYPSYRKVRAALAFALAHADKEENLMRRDAMIHELRSLVKRHPQDPIIFDYFLMTLSTTIQKENSINRQDMLLDIFRDVCHRHPEIRPRELLASALLYATGDAEKNGYTLRRNHLMEEFTILSEKHPHQIKLQDMIRNSSLDQNQFRFIFDGPPNEPPPTLPKKK